MMIIGGVFGMILGLEVFDELLDPPTKKLGFVSIWFSFAFALFLLNRQHKRKTFDTIQNCGWWETLLLILTGKLLLRLLYENSFKYEGMPYHLGNSSHVTKCISMD